MGSTTIDPPEPAPTALLADVGVGADRAFKKPDRLKRDQLSLPGIIASTLANIAPAMSFYFGFALIAYTAGVASPLTIIAAMIAVIFVGNTLAQFSKLTPSTGSWITFIGKGLGPVAGTMAAAVYVLGLMPGAASFIGIQGGWLSEIFQTYCHVNVPWQLLSVVLALIVFLLVSRGISLSPGDLHVHRLGELGGPCRRDQSTAQECSEGHFLVHWVHGHLLHLPCVRNGRRL